MKDVYVEWLVSKQRSVTDNIIRVASLMLTILCLVFYILTFNVVVMLAMVVLGLFTFFAYRYTDVEYEYVYVSGELGIDRILAKSKRKRMETLNVQSVEIMAPLNSHRLDGFKHRKLREYDYTTGVKNTHGHVFALYCDNKKILIEPNRELAEAIRDAIPHKAYIEM